MNGVSEKKIVNLYTVLKWTYGLVAIVAGADKFFNAITQWEKYVSPMVHNLLPISLTHFLYLVGVIEIVVGILILTKYTRIGAYLLVAWLILIVLNLLSMNAYYDICVRDLVMAVGAYALAQLCEIVHPTHAAPNRY